jgi:hypothetical protein
VVSGSLLLCRIVPAVTKQRCRTDWAHFVKALLDGRYRDAATVTLVMDQLNTHSPASFYEAFDPAEAKRLATGWRSITRPSMARG